MNRDTLLWKNDHPYGFTLSPLPVLHATVSSTRHVHAKIYTARVSFESLYVQQGGFTTVRPAQLWCEDWILHFLEFQKMKQLAA